MIISKKVKVKSKKLFRIRYFLLLTFNFLLFIFYFEACTPLVKKPVSEATQGPSVSVLLSTIESKDSLSFSGRFILHSEEARYEFGENNRNLNIIPLTDGIQLYNQNRNLLYRQNIPILLEPADATSRFIFHGHTYAGSIYFQPTNEGSVYLINKILLEDYLSGVVPAEIPAIRKDDFEAIKSQAICARTYALNRIVEKSDTFYDVKATVADQVYGGFDRHSALADQAIEETHGVIITYNDQPATVYYHSTCGGHLESALNVWPINPVPYLEGGNDAVSDIYSCSASPYFRWLETRSFTELDSLFELQFKKGRLKDTVEDTIQVNIDLHVVERNSSGRVSDLQISSADTTVTLSGYEIRHFFKDKNGVSLPSTLFYMSQPDDSTLTIHGGGYGHGVGMCQFGALYMARRGFMHYHIINKYFPGTKLVRKY
jgi:stage II sporulation protein D